MKLYTKEERELVLTDKGTIRPRACKCRCPGCPSFYLDYGKCETADKKEPSVYRTLQSWKAMRNRVFNKNHDSYRLYGKKGISICLWWDYQFEFFKEDMGLRPDDMTLDRVNPAGDYTPYNCRWADILTQANNRKNNIDYHRSRNFAPINRNRICSLSVRGLAKEEQMAEAQRILESRLESRYYRLLSEI